MPRKLMLKMRLIKKKMNFRNFDDVPISLEGKLNKIFGRVSCFDGGPNASDGEKGCGGRGVCTMKLV